MTRGEGAAKGRDRVEIAIVSLMLPFCSKVLIGGGDESGGATLRRVVSLSGLGLVVGSEGGGPVSGE